MREFIRLCFITVASMVAIASVLHLSVALGRNESPTDALIALGISLGAFGVWGLLDRSSPKASLQMP
ncbi:hypothetical protein [Hydrogenophaga sp.]